MADFGLSLVTKDFLPENKGEEVSVKVGELYMQVFRGDLWFRRKVAFLVQLHCMTEALCSP